jgi:hypothetical protein
MTIRPNGKGTEKIVVRELRKAYGIHVDIQRLTDKSDTGNYEDVRPSDFIVLLGRKLAQEKGLPQIFYVEAKETTKSGKSISINSMFRKGQIQAMKRSIPLGIPYFVVIQFLDTKEVCIIPCTFIVETLAAGAKSLSVAEIKKHPWTTGELHDYFIA